MAECRGTSLRRGGSVLAGVTACPIFLQCQTPTQQTMSRSADYDHEYEDGDGVALGLYCYPKNISFNISSSVDTVLLTEDEVRDLRDRLTKWLDDPEP